MRAVACSADHWLGGIRGYDLTDGRPTFTLSGEFQRAESVTLSPDGGDLGTSRSDWRIKAVDLMDGGTRVAGGSRRG